MARKIAPRPRIDRRFESSLVQLEITNVSKAGATCQRERTEAIYEQRDWGSFMGFCIVNDEILEMGKECDRELGMSVFGGSRRGCFASFPRERLDMREGKAHDHSLHRYKQSLVTSRKSNSEQLAA